MIGGPGDRSTFEAWSFGFDWIDVQIVDGAAVVAGVQRVDLVVDGRRRSRRGPRSRTSSSSKTAAGDWRWPTRPISRLSEATIRRRSSSNRSSGGTRRGR
jgi:hypothetical protein